ncbi:cytochrome P450 [Streptomyces mutabilis]|jgi:epi-isozizaene 5-monooxygenase|uniref:bifunctional albaflavenone monooxygenase/terpene synthase n=1 Tax=Streptomyces TaxID=1883 RepID=UPI000BC36836|nr:MULTISPECIES: cytochrome P450 [unclassified Streptomyces]MDN3250219.1 cytochrome P450 [Streptomyces sp. ZSW22]MDN3255024.1 cytochrome P450 [Streptomyces sp. MA25(2023)]MDQ0385443.1 epi-isozizaene 5-monooxygenase [Streptomyces sp. DSM 42143]PAK26342.1 cytochrome P450 [Streptomyces sp. alain-838]
MTVESVNPETRTDPAPELREPPVAGGGVPLLGHGWRLARDPLAFMSQLRDHGDIVRIKLGPKTVYAVTTPELTGALALSPDYHIAGPLWESLEGLLGKEGVATANGPLHRRQRRTIQPAFRLDAIPAYGPIMEEEAHALTERWQPGRTVDATSESFRVAVRVAARCLLRGQYMDERAERLCVALATVFRGMYRRMVVPLGPLYRLPLPANRAFNDALADLHRLVDEIIAERRASGQKPDDLLTALLEAKDDNGDPIGEQEIHDQVVAILTPGSETIASTIMWLLQALADHPEHADRIRDEVEAVTGGRPVAFEDVRKLTHTGNVIVEAMRLRPAVWVLTRRAVVETELGGYRIPAGADIIYSPYAIQRDPKSYAHNLEFDPDRWLPERAANVPKYAMKPFSAGKRKCPSDHFSMAQLTLITAALATKYRFEQVAGSNDAVRVGITLRPHDLLVRPVAR